MLTKAKQEVLVEKKALKDKKKAEKLAQQNELVEETKSTFQEVIQPK